MIYFAHPVSDYGTVHEAACLAAIEAAFSPPDVEVRIYNPNSPEGSRGYRDGGMRYFEGIIGTCSALVYRPFGDGMIGAGVACEIACAIGLGIPVHELVETTRGRLVLVPVVALNASRALDVEQTRARLVGRRTAA
ncbi:hypothetical protein [Lichenibacterium minor]|uniref:hypothetical protein n=1 Tax=Lichenibacterium minor TaxID=2316528 RepID=UPI0013EBBC66|nr:hypothetical protein [Lichenibacterium minor]